MWWDNVILKSHSISGKQNMESESYILYPRGLHQHCGTAEMEKYLTR